LAFSISNFTSNPSYNLIWIFGWDCIVGFDHIFDCISTFGLVLDDLSLMLICVVICDETVNFGWIYLS